ncbi:hypothetical protein [Paenibacillus sp. FSL P2-0136]|uniref:hypothetical protein n=1 Tax=unclassified Paenibacillus TaxID=185978 RepID=UPI0030DBC5DF
MLRSFFNKKKFSAVLLSIVFVFITAIPSANAYTTGTCATLTTCYTAAFTSSDSFVQTQAVYLTQGQGYQFGFYNNGSVHNMALGIYRYPDYTLVVGPKGILYNETGNLNFYGQAPSDGYYYARVQCGGSGQVGCSGYAWIAK